MKRLVYLDWLRFLAIIAVVTIHTAASMVAVNMNEVPLSNWLAANFYEAISRPSVPLFVMISGALLLSAKRELTLFEFLKKRTGKIFIPLVAWSLIFYIYKVYSGSFETFNPKQFIYLFLTQGISIPYWFMYMILGLYLTAPIIKIFVNHAKRRDIEYFLLLWLYASIVVKFMNFYLGFSLNLELYVVTNYIGYFVLGYYLTTFEIKKPLRTLIYLAGLAGYAATFFFTWYSTAQADGALQEFWYEYHSPNVMMSAVATFLFLKYLISKETERMPRGLNGINEASFGIYLTHILVMTILSNEIFTPVEESLHPMVSIPVNVTLTMLISTVIVMVIRKIPIMKNLIP
ncbi:MAG: acyltransferase family protein [Mesobacillus sp.]